MTAALVWGSVFIVIAVVVVVGHALSVAYQELTGRSPLKLLLLGIALGLIIAASAFRLQWELFGGTVAKNIPSSLSLDSLTALRSKQR